MDRRTAVDAHFGEIIRERRVLAGLSQERLAEAANLHRNYVGLVERGVHSPSLAAIVALARALGVTAADLVREAERYAEPVDDRWGGQA